MPLYVKRYGSWLFTRSQIADLEALFAVGMEDTLTFGQLKLLTQVLTEDGHWSDSQEIESKFLGRQVVGREEDYLQILFFARDIDAKDNSWLLISAEADVTYEPESNALPDVEALLSAGHTQRLERAHKIGLTDARWFSLFVGFLLFFSVGAVCDFFQISPSNLTASMLAMGPISGIIAWIICRPVMVRRALAHVEGG